MKFYLGTCNPADAMYCDVPLFISVRTVLTRKIPVESDDWIMDSGGFFEIGKHGRYTISESEYLDCIGRLNPVHAFCQDWMCETSMLERTGKSVREHQELTVQSHLNLSAQSSKVLPVIQGQSALDYIQNIEMYLAEGVSIDNIFGLGSVCCRQSTNEIKTIVGCIQAAFPGIKLHGFGVKTSGLIHPEVIAGLYSVDSMAWSLKGRFHPMACPDCLEKPGRANKKLYCCDHCIQFGMAWRENILKIMVEVESPRQNYLNLKRRIAS